MNSNSTMESQEMPFPERENKPTTRHNNNNNNNNDYNNKNKYKNKNNRNKNRSARNRRNNPKTDGRSDPASPENLEKDATKEPFMHPHDGKDGPENHYVSQSDMLPPPLHDETREFEKRGKPHNRHKPHYARGGGGGRGFKRSYRNNRNQGRPPPRNDSRNKVTHEDRPEPDSPSADPAPDQLNTVVENEGTSDLTDSPDRKSDGAGHGHNAESEDINKPKHRNNRNPYPRGQKKNYPKHVLKGRKAQQPRDDRLDSFAASTDDHTDNDGARNGDTFQGHGDSKRKNGHNKSHKFKSKKQHDAKWKGKQNEEDGRDYYNDENQTHQAQQTHETKPIDGITSGDYKSKPHRARKSPSDRQNSQPPHRPDNKGKRKNFGKSKKGRDGRFKNTCDEFDDEDTHDLKQEQAQESGICSFVDEVRSPAAESGSEMVSETNPVDLLSKEKEDKDEDDDTTMQPTCTTAPADDCSSVTLVDVTEEVEDDREKYKANRKALKKARQRAERLEKRLEALASLSVLSGAFFQWSSHAQQEKNQTEDAPADAAITEAQTKKNVQEKKIEKKQRRQEQRQEQRAAEAEDRIAFWRKHVEFELECKASISKVLEAEMVRQFHSEKHVFGDGFDFSQVLSRIETRTYIEDKVHSVYIKLYASTENRRFVVDGMKDRDLNGRLGSVRSWDEKKEKFLVALDSKKGRDQFELYLKPEMMNYDVAHQNSKKSSSVDAEAVVEFFHVPISAARFHSFGGKLILKRSFAEQVRQSDKPDVMLAGWVAQRTQEEEERIRRAKLQAQREMEERKKREQQRKQYEAERQRQREFEAKVRYEKKRQQNENRRQKRRNWDPFYDVCNGKRGCKCQYCQLRQFFFFRASGGSMPFFFVFEDDDDDEYFYRYEDDGPYEDYYEDEEEDYYGRFEKSNHEEVANAANILGVDVDAGSSDIKKAFRQQALRYHPDKFKADDSGMTAAEAEEHFKNLANAYEVMRGHCGDD